MPKIYFHPKANKPGDDKTHYRLFYGKGAAFELNKTTQINNITDGLSNTLMAVEAEEPVVWTNPNDLAFDPTKALPKMLVIYRAVATRSALKGLVIDKNSARRALLGGVSPFILIIWPVRVGKLNPFLTILLANRVSLVNNVCGLAI